MSVASSSEPTPTQLVIDALTAAGSRVARGSGQWIAQCPAHGDRMPSLTVQTGRDGKALVYCHAGCDTRDVLDAIGLRQADLFPDAGRDEPVRLPWAAYLKALQEIDAPKAPGDRLPRGLPENLRREKIAHYDYLDADGHPVARVVKYQLVDTTSGEVVGKTFTQHATDGQGGWKPNLDGFSPPLYRLPEVVAAVAAGLPVFVVEGEKDADTGTQRLGITATTSPMGAGAWKRHHTEALAGANVAIIVDQDQAGRSHAEKVRSELEAAGCHVTLLRPAVGKDLTDHVDAGRGISDLLPVEPEDPDDEDEARRAFVLDRLPILDWHALWADETEDEWIVEPILPARRLVALYSAPKLGKSLLMLEIAAAVASGRDILGTTPARPRTVLYIDFENDPKGDIRERLKAMRYAPADLARLRYLSFPTLAVLDSAAGSRELMAAVEVYQAEVVVIDTVSRAVKGEENENDTWLAFYRHTGLSLKQAGVACVRLDHSGKDEAKGQRGGSAKSGDVDAVWRLSAVSDATFRLDCEAARLQITEKTLVLRRESLPLRHTVDPYGKAAIGRAKVEHIVKALDSLGVADDAGEHIARQALKDAGVRAGSDFLRQALKARQARRNGFGEVPGDHLAESETARSGEVGGDDA